MGITNFRFIQLRTGTKEGKLVYRKVRVVNEGCYLFFNAQHLLIQLGSEARAFFDYLCERMRTDTNRILVDRALKQDFIEHIGRLTGGSVVPAMNSLNRYVSVFKNLGLLVLDISSLRGYYFVNPKYAYKGTKNGRVELLEKMIRERVNKKLSLKGLIDSTEENFR
jgi:hypothetical protein